MWLTVAAAPRGHVPAAGGVRDGGVRAPCSPDSADPAGNATGTRSAEA
jgi:hypothetical protein